MNGTLLVAIYGAILSTTLAVIAIINFIRERRIIAVEQHFSYELKTAYYNFVVANISSRPFTIVDCAIMNLARTDKGDLQPDWGIQPYVLKSIFGDDDEEKKPLALPHTLNPGEIIIVGTDTEEIIEQYSLYSNMPMDTKKGWNPTNRMQLEISHSMSRKLFLKSFELEEGELSRLTSQKAK